jgi:hypothetical protein
MRHGCQITPRRCVLHCRNSPRRRGPGAVALVMWNMKRRHSFHSCKKAAAEAAVKGAPFFGAFIEAKRRPFTDDRSGGYRAAARRDARSANSPTRNAANDKELISSPRELNSSRSGMEYLSHSGAKRRLPPASATRTPAQRPAPPRPCVFNKLTPQQPESAQPRITALFSTVAI